MFPIIITLLVLTFIVVSYKLYNTISNYKLQTIKLQQNLASTNTALLQAKAENDTLEMELQLLKDIYRNKLLKAAGFERESVF